MESASAKEVFLHYVCAHYCQHTSSHCSSSVDKEKHVYKHHLEEVLDKCVQPLFVLQTDTPAHNHKGRYADPVKDEEIVEAPLWKETDRGFDGATIVEWIVSQGTATDLSCLLPKLLPPTLRIADNYDFYYKQRGVVIIHALVIKLPQTTFMAYGLQGLFAEILFKSLAYVSDTEVLPTLVCAYTCLVDLGSRLKDPDKQVFMEKILTEGVLVGAQYAGHRPAVLLILLTPLPAIYHAIGIAGVRYLKQVLSMVCQGLSVLHNAKSASESLLLLNEKAAECLACLLEQCWPRIPFYSGMVLKTLANAWICYYDRQDSTAKTLCQWLKKDYQWLHASCHEIIKADVEALLSHDARLASLLCTPVERIK
ncbi:hypothetical protein BDF14DRAFT_1859375 [Spinellus fusiger]|nr:hypothetical protein BDF14DRAFT_1859375 [Spinellus fusiger]